MYDRRLLSFLPHWPLALDQLGWVALILIVAGVLGEAARVVRLPRLLGYVVAGMLLGPASPRLMSADTLAAMRPVLDVTLGVLLFELGHRIDLSWLRRNPSLLVASVLEAGLTAVAVFFALRVVGVAAIYAAGAAAIGIATSPAVVMQITRELRAQGQVSERLLALTALNSIYAVLALTVWLSWLHMDYRGSPLTVLVHPQYLIYGSLALALAAATIARVVPHQLRSREDTQLLLVLGLVLLLIASAHALEVSGLLALLSFGALAKHWVPWLRVLPKHLPTISSIAVVVLFTLVGAGLDPAVLVKAPVVVLAFVGARMAAKIIVTAGTAAPSGVSQRKGALLGVALAPMSALAVVMVEDVSGIYPAFPADLLVIILAAVLVLEIVGPVLTQFALIRSGEARPE